MKKNGTQFEAHDIINKGLKKFKKRTHRNKSIPIKLRAQLFIRSVFFE